MALTGETMEEQNIITGCWYNLNCSKTQRYLWGFPPKQQRNPDKGPIPTLVKRWETHMYAQIVDHNIGTDSLQLWTTFPGLVLLYLHMGNVISGQQISLTIFIADEGMIYVVAGRKSWLVSTPTSWDPIRAVWCHSQGKEPKFRSSNKPAVRLWKTMGDLPPW